MKHYVDLPQKCKLLATEGRPYTSLNITFMGIKWQPKCSPAPGDPRYIFGFALCKGYDLI